MNTTTVHTGAHGLTLSVCEWGAPRPSRPPVLLLHGYLEQGAAWDAVAQHLSGQIVAPDHRGHGLSDHVPAGGFYHFWDYVSDVDALVTHLGGEVDLVGHSMGGTVAMLYAGSRPERVRRLVLAEGLGPPDTTARSLDHARQYLDAMASPPQHRVMADLSDAASRLGRWAKAMDPSTAQRLAKRITRPATPHDVPPGTSPPEGSLVWTWDPLHRSRSPRPFSEAQFQHFAAAYTGPTLVLDGADSGFLVKAQAHRRAWLQHPEHIEIPNAGHLMHHDAPEATAAAIERFLSAPPPP